MTAVNVSEFYKLFNQIKQASGNSLSGSDFGEGRKSYNEIAWLTNALTTASSEQATPEQKASAMQDMLQKALKIFEKIMGNEANQARNEVENQTSKTQKLLDKSNELTVKLNGKFKKVANSIDKQTKIVKKANKLLEKAKKSIEEKQEEIQKVVDEIAEKQEELKSAKTEEDKARILGEIQGLVGQIAQIGLTIEEDNENLQNLTKAVENSVDNIEDATAKMEVIEQDGVARIQEIAQEAGQASAEIAETGTKGATNKVTGEAAEKAAEAASTNIFSGASIAPKLYMTANDQKQASSTRLASIEKNVHTICQGIGGLNNATDIIANFQNSIGKALRDFAGIIGQWDTAVEPVITSLGSFAGIAKASEELDQAAETDLSTLGYEVDESGEVQKTEQKDDNDNGKKPEDKENKGEELKTPDFDINKLRTFGV